MIQVYVDGVLIFDPRLPDYQLENPAISLELNKTGQFTFTLYPDHPGYGAIQKLKSIVEVQKDGAVLFRGRPLSSQEGFYRQQTYTCEGELAFLLDSRVRPFEMEGGVAEIFAYLIHQHNEQVDAYKQFKVGNVTVTDPNDYINRSNITYETTWDILNSRLIDTLGGYLWVRHETDGVYLDYLEDFPYMSTQRVTLGENLLSYAHTRDGSEIATALIPLGARLEDEEGNQTDERLTIAEVNDEKDYVYDETAVAQYGWIFTTQTWDDVTQAGNLKQKALDALLEKNKTVDTIEMTAADLSHIDKILDDFQIGQYVFVDSPPHGMDGDKFLVTKMALRLDDPIVRYFPDLLPPRPDERLTRLCISDMLRMATCHRATTYKTAPCDCWAASFFTVAPTHEPGTLFQYDTSATQVLGVLCERLSGQGLLEFLQNRVFDAAGATGPKKWLTDPSGAPQGGSAANRPSKP